MGWSQVCSAKIDDQSQPLSVIPSLEFRQTNQVSVNTCPVALPSEYPVELCRGRAELCGDRNLGHRSRSNGGEAGEVGSRIMISDQTQRDLAETPGGGEVEIRICHPECMRGLRSRLSWIRLTCSVLELDIEHLQGVGTARYEAIDEPPRVHLTDDELYIDLNRIVTKWKIRECSK